MPQAGTDPDEDGRHERPLPARAELSPGAPEDEPHGREVCGETDRARRRLEARPEAVDRGGNNVQVTWHGRPTNLHSVWDSEIIDSERLSYTEFAAFIDPPAQARVSEWQKTGYMDWMRESFELRGRAYDVGNGQLGYAYSFQNLPLVRLRLAQSAVRLAGVLNSIFR